MYKAALFQVATCIQAMARGTYFFSHTLSYCIWKRISCMWSEVVIVLNIVDAFRHNREEESTA
eukprot:m.220315 g.220315  ORF g.220315 m.220315 type:complete len:63 (+) comp39935_c0_seq33:1071-1259(+)